MIMRIDVYLVTIAILFSSNADANAYTDALQLGNEIIRQNSNLLEQDYLDSVQNGFLDASTNQQMDTNNLDKGRYEQSLNHEQSILAPYFQQKGRNLEAGPLNLRLESLRKRSNEENIDGVIIGPEAGFLDQITPSKRDALSRSRLSILGSLDILSDMLAAQQRRKVDAFRSRLLKIG
ncbi:unnamed protein product [Owenia fusiformis]|nr:unnamed protein product [Owenia fusiformis]